MRESFKSQFLKASFVFFGLILTSACQVSNADVKSEQFQLANQIKIDKAHKENRRYVINGKTINWEDLSASQQNRILAVEDKIKIAEHKIELKEKEIESIIEKMDLKTAEIDNIADEIDDFTVTIEKENINLRDIEKLALQLEEKVSKNEHLIALKEIDLSGLEKQLEAIDMLQISEIEGHVEELESVLDDIFEEVK